MSYVWNLYLKTRKWKYEWRTSFYAVRSTLDLLFWHLKQCKLIFVKCFACCIFLYNLIVYTEKMSKLTAFIQVKNIMFLIQPKHINLKVPIAGFEFLQCILHDQILFQVSLCCFSLNSLHWELLQYLIVGG